MSLQKHETPPELPDENVVKKPPLSITKSAERIPTEKDDCCKSVSQSSLNPKWIPPSQDTLYATAETIFPPVPLFQLFRYASCSDIILTIVGVITATLSGFGFPAMNYIFGQMTQAFTCNGKEENESSYFENYTNVTPNSSSLVNYTLSPTQVFSFYCGNMTLSNNTVSLHCEKYIGDRFVPAVRELSFMLLGVGAAQFVLGYFMVTSLCMASENQILTIRSLFLKSFLRQDVAWFDIHKAGEFASRTSDDLEKVKHGIGDKVGLVIYTLVNCIVGITLALVMGWKLSLVILTVTPVIIFAQSLIMKADTKFAIAMLNEYAKAGNIAEEVLTSIRTVVAFGGESKEVDRYHKNLNNARKSSIKRSIFVALGTSIQWFTIFATYALGFWYGVHLLIDDMCKENPAYITSVVITVFFNISNATMFAPQLHPHITAISTATSAAAFPFHVIRRIPFIDSQSTAGVKPKQLIGNIKFDNVSFRYPSRPSVKVLEHFNLEINRGETVALVGESGCGKSTTIQLIQRFYDVLEGCVSVDGLDVKLVNVGWLRKHIGVVGQEPVLFGISILENIRCGREDAAMEDIVHAAKQANAHEFIMRLPLRYDTLVGERGAQLSGGQKQRIAIARALVRDPKILLLDEATSALDTENEQLVQHALEKASAGRTTVIVAHRLSTIINSDKVIVISKGKIVEMGTHDQLMKLKNYYYELVKRQIEKKDSSSEEESDYTESEDEGMTMKDKMMRVESSRKSIRSNLTSKRTSLAVCDRMQDEEKKVKHSSLGRILRMSGPECLYIFFGLIGSIGLGFGMPAIALIYGRVFKAFSYMDPDKAADEVNFGAILFLTTGAAVVIANSLQIIAFNVSGENLTMRLRKFSLAAILKQDMTWLDRESNSVGILCSKLSGDTSKVQGAIKACAETLFHAVCTIVLAIAVSLFINYKMGFVALAFMPFFVLALVWQQRIQHASISAQSMALDKANRMAIEAISNLRTVTSFHLAEKINAEYFAELLKPHKISVRTSHIRGLMYGFAVCVHYFSTATCMYYGSILTYRGEIKISDVLAIVQLVTIGSYVTGTIMALSSSYNAAMVSAERIFELLDLKPKIDATSTDGIRMAPEDEVSISMKKVYFNYENRPSATVLRGLELNIPKGKCTALVGSSGCGKSTCVQLLERYYDPLDGQILVDGIDIRRYNVESLRSKIGIVSQEPILFDRSIKENIAYGDNSRTVSMDEIFVAARKANIHSFISTLPEGYETNVGDKGVQMSGGQKQRIAIARALIRNPHILLLDEATSALDAESEKIVQQTLDDVQKGRTTIVIAHRLTTIKNADQIAVIYRGKVVESGTHTELLERKGYYYNFSQTQMGNS